MRGHRRQSVCDQLHCIAHSYSGTLSSIIYCYYSAHGAQKYKKDASRERKRLFYYNISNWDNILHTFSGAMIGALGFSIVTLLNKTEKVPMELSPLFVALFSFCFAVTLGVVWEFYEYTFDGLLGLNMQKFALENGTLLIGRAALADTMMDLVVDAVGAFIMSVIGYISLKYNKGWIERLQVKMTK